jgi:hypothetical protein
MGGEPFGGAQLMSRCEGLMAGTLNRLQANGQFAERYQNRDPDAPESAR